MQCQLMIKDGSVLAPMHNGYTDQGRSGTPLDREALGYVCGVGLAWALRKWSSFQ